MNITFKKLLNKIRYLYLSKIFKYKKPIFIVGCGHSGTSIALSILSNHPKIYGIPYETYFFLKSPINFGLIYGYFRLAGSRYLLEKTPKHVTCIKKILRIFPQCRIIVMLRDGRDVSCSIKERTGNFEKGVSRWINDNQQWIPFKNKKNILVVKLEDLVRDKEKKIEDILRFLELENYGSILDYYKNKRKFFRENNKTDNVKHNKFREYQINQPLKNTTCRWRDEMTDSEKKYFRTKANDLLINLGYEKDHNWN